MEMEDDDSGWKRVGFGRACVDLFRELGYDEGELHADMFEWLFGLPSLRIQAFLDWFLTSIRPRQSVKRQLHGDYAVYKALLAGKLGNNGCLLTGDELVRAELACQSDAALQNNGDDDSLDTLEAANASLERDIHEMESKLRLATGRNDRLAKLVQRRTLESDSQRQRAQRNVDKDHFNELLAQLVPGSRQKAPQPEDLVTKIQRTLHHLATPSNDITNAMVASASSLATTASSSMLSVSSGSSFGSTTDNVSLYGEQGNRAWRDFLYMHSMKQLESVEEQNIRALQARIPAISALSSSQPSSQVEDAGDASVGDGQEMPPPSPWLHESDPVQLNMRDQDVMLYNKCCVELERLRKAFVVGERDALLAQLQVTRYESHLRQLTTSRRQLLQQFQLMSQDAIWARKQILLSSLDKTKRQVGDLFQRAFPEKLEELAFLKSTSILLKSYEQKLWRQENRFIKLRLLLEGFEMQNARLRLAHRLLDAERQDLIRVEAIFQQLMSTLQQLNRSTEQRISAYNNTSGSEAALNTLSQTYLNEQDDLAHRLFEILEQLVHGTSSEPSSDTQLMNHGLRLRTFDELVRLAELKQSNEQSVHDSMQQIQGEWQRLYKSKRFTLNQLRIELFGDATSSTPMLLPREVASALQEATETKDAAEEALEKALETLRLHKRSVQVDPTKRLQQQQHRTRLQQELDARAL